MKKRVVTSIFIVAITVFAVLSKLLPHVIGKYIFDVFCLFVMTVAGFEMANIFEKANRPTNKFMATMYGVFNYIVLQIMLISKVQFYLILLAEVLALLLYAGITFVVETVNKKRATNQQNFATTINTTIACLYPTFWFGLLLQINHIDAFVGVANFSLIFVILMFAIAMLTDTMAFLVGVTFKGPKLAPKISPKKTISGAFGGLIGGVLGAMIVYWVATAVPDLASVITRFNFAWWHFFLMGLVGSVLGQVGDLFESKLKRNAGVKDSGNIFPGHGGMMDRIDAMTFVVMFLYLIVALVAI